MATLRQISFDLDMTYHGKSQAIEDVKALRNKLWQALVCILM
jgi:hypothetical protein